MEQCIYLVHHGIKGQRWGVRRYQNEDGTLTPAGKERYGSVENLISGEKKEAENRKKALKALAIVGGITLAAAATYYIADKYYIDKTISAGTVFKKGGIFDDNGQMEAREGMYMSYKKGDNLIYKYGYAGQVYMSKPNAVFEQRAFTFSKDIKVASVHTSRKIFNDLMKKDPEFALEAKRIHSIMNADSVIPRYKNVYDSFNVALTETKDYASTKAFYEQLRKSGYNALSDINDMKYSGYGSKAPVIYIGDSSNKLTLQNKETVNKAAAGAFYVGMSLKKPALSLGIAGASAAVFKKYDSYNDEMQARSKYIANYKKQHPNTKMTDNEIYKLKKK